MPPAARSRSRTPVTPESLHDLVLLGAPALSPDGSRVAFVHKHIGKKNNYVTKAKLKEKMNTPGITKEKEAKKDLLTKEQMSCGDN